MKVPLSIGIVSSRLSHGHAHCTSANWALKKALALVLLRLGLIDREYIVAELAIEVIDFLFKAEAADSFLALHAKIHLFDDELSPTSALVVYEWRSKFCKPPHLF